MSPLCKGTINQWSNQSFSTVTHYRSECSSDILEGHQGEGKEQDIFKRREK